MPVRAAANQMAPMALVTDSRRMVAMIRCTTRKPSTSVSRTVARGQAAGAAMDCTRPRKDWRRGAHLTLLVASGPGGDVISGLGWTTGIRRADDLGKSWTCPAWGS